MGKHINFLSPKHHTYGDKHPGTNCVALVCSSELRHISSVTLCRSGLPTWTLLLRWFSCAIPKPSLTQQLFIKSYCFGILISFSQRHYKMISVSSNWYFSNQDLMSSVCSLLFPHIASEDKEQTAAWFPGALVNNTKRLFPKNSMMISSFQFIAFFGKTVPNLITGLFTRAVSIADLSGTLRWLKILLWQSYS